MNQKNENGEESQEASCRICNHNSTEMNNSSYKHSDVENLTKDMRSLSCNCKTFNLVKTHNTETLPNQNSDKISIQECQKKSPHSKKSIGIEHSEKYGGKPTSGERIKMCSPYLDVEDSDELTDYSVLYSEDTYEEGKKYVDEDQLKTYCTEGTPYQTPHNLSCAASMTGLHYACEAKAEVVEDAEPKKHQDSSSNTLLQNVVLSGTATPEKPVAYFEEGTPASLSRISSFSSLHSMEDEESRSKVVAKEKYTEHRQEKLVRFGGCVVETPLMFSRSSSPSSLNSCDEFSVCSSIVSDFSRRASEVVSPSDLPDSPGETIPPSPQIPDSPVDFSRTIPGVGVLPKVIQDEKTGDSLNESHICCGFDKDSPNCAAKDISKCTYTDAEEELEGSLSGDEDMLAACISMAMPDMNKGSIRRGKKKK